MSAFTTLTLDEKKELQQSVTQAINKLEAVLDSLYRARIAQYGACLESGSSGAISRAVDVLKTTAEDRRAMMHHLGSIKATLEFWALALVNSHEEEEHEEEEGGQA